MFSKNFQRKYALTDQGLRNVRKGAFWTVIVNLVVMAGMGILYLLMGGFMGTLTEGASLPGPLLFAGLTVLFVVLSFVTHLQQYQATYGLVYNEVKGTRLSLAERLRKLPLGYFGKRDLADLTETIMGDVNRMEHVWSHVLGYLRGAYIEKYGITLYVGIGIPIPILDEDLAKRVSIRNEQIETTVVDYGNGNQILGKTNYAALQSGAIEINGHKVRTAPLSSLAKAREIADLLKSWIQKGEFLLTEPVRPMPVQASLNGLKAIED